MISDAVAMFEAGADGLFIKPTGIDDPQTRLATRQYAPKLIEALVLVVDRHMDNLNQFKRAYEANITGGKKEVAHLIKAWQAFRNQ